MKIIADKDNIILLEYKKNNDKLYKICYKGKTRDGKPKTLYETEDILKANQLFEFEIKFLGRTIFDVQKHNEYEQIREIETGKFRTLRTKREKKYKRNMQTFTDSEKIEIKKLSNTMKISNIAKMYDCHYNVIYRIIEGRVRVC